MNLALILLAVLSMPCAGSFLRLATVKQPTYIKHCGGPDRIAIIDVPYVTRANEFDFGIEAISTPFIPPTDCSRADPLDINLTSLYGIETRSEYKVDINTTEVVIDVTKARVPPEYPFSLDQVVEAVVTCVRLMRPAEPEGQHKLVITVVK